MRPISSRPMAIALCALAALLGACAQERAPIDRVQPNYVSKTFFLGADLADPADDPEFYYRATLIDVASGAGGDGLFTNTDAQPTTRVRWELTEKMLIARLTYELVNGTDHKGARRTADGQVVAAFAIESHFDIKHDYNTSTGEELNVLVENTADRPWNLREYVRVDWSKNLVTHAYDLDALSMLGIYGNIVWEPIAYYVNDPASPDAPVFDAKTGYFDITNKVWAAPQIIHDAEWGDYPACWNYGHFPTENCNPSEVTFRMSFRKVVDTDYEPLEYPGPQMDLFGYFTSDRFGYDRRYGVVDDKWHRFATRWNLFEKSHADVPCATTATTPVGLSPHRDVSPKDGTEDECASVGKGSRCDEFRGQCTLPLRDRKIRTIAWHVNPGFPDDLFDSTSDALKAWDDAMRVAVVAGRLAECRRVGEAGCEQAMAWPAPWGDDFVPALGSDGPDKVPNIFVLCHNPVDPAKGDVEACGPAATAPRLGDLRYNFISVISDPQETSPWGIMMDAEDPLTGEKIAGSVNEWGAVLDRAASTLVDLIGLLNGEIDPKTYIAGQNVADWVQANGPGGGAERDPGMSADEASSRLNAFDQKSLAPLLAGVSKRTGKVPPHVRHQERAQALSDSGRLGQGNLALAERLRRLRGTPIEAMLVSPMMAQAAGFDPTIVPSADALQRASPFGRMNPAMRKADARAKLLGRSKRHSCEVKALAPDDLLGMAKTAAKDYPAPDPKDLEKVNAHKQAIWTWARQQYNKGVLAHELGHSMGLRHNFAASFDALNYGTGYWQLRTRNGAVVAPCADGTTDGKDCIGPRWKDPLAQEEIDGNIGKYATTSVMDYPGDNNQDMLVAGKYDRAALRFGYSNTVDVWAAPGVSVKKENATAEGQKTAYRLTGFTTSPGLFGVYYFPPVDPAQPTEFLHYSQYQNAFQLISGCKADAAGVAGMKCVDAPMDVVDYRDMVDFVADPTYAAFDWAVDPRTVDDKGRVRRGYLFNSDEYADTGNVPCFTNDAGADAYEQIRFLESMYENRYILDSFRRNRVQFNSWDVSDRIQTRYLDTIQGIAKTYSFAAVLDGDPLNPSATFLSDGYYGPLAIGASVALDLFARILTRPEPGYFCNTDFSADPNCPGMTNYGTDTFIWAPDTVPLPGAKDAPVYGFRVGLGDGRYLHNDFDYSKGYWWSDYQTQVGTYYEKIWATYYLSEAFDDFLSNSKEDFTDSRYKNVSFSTVYPDQVRRLYNALLTTDMEAYAPWVITPGAPKDIPTAPLQYPAWHAAKGPNARPSRAKIVDPNYGWNEQLYSMVYGMIFFPTDWSQQFVHEARIAIKPDETPAWPADETFVFFDPKTALTYKAHSSGTETLMGAAHQRSAGARMLEHANKLAAYVYLVKLDADGAPLFNADGTPQFDLDANGKPQLDLDKDGNPNYSGAEAELRKYVDTIDLFRELSGTFATDFNNMPQP